MKRRFTFDLGAGNAVIGRAQSIPFDRDDRVPRNRSALASRLSAASGMQTTYLLYCGIDHTLESNVV
jgi:hypothetical protein